MQREPFAVEYKNNNCFELGKEKLASFWCKTKKRR